MYAPLSPKIELSTAQLANLSQRFESLSTVPALAQLLCVTEQTLLSIVAKPEYSTFYIPKPGGEKRFIELVRTVVLRHTFVINENKVQMRTRAEQPVITGLVIGHSTKPSLSKSWLKRLKQEIQIYEWLMSEAVRQRGLFHAFVFDNFRRSVLGQVEFVGFVEGKDSSVFRKMASKVRWG